MQKKPRLITIIFSTILILCMMTSCGNRGRMLQVISDFEDGCNSLDVKAILETIDPRISNKYKVAVTVIEFFSGHSSEELIGTVFNNLPEEFNESSEEILSSIVIDVETIEIDDDTAKVTAVMEYELMGQHLKREVLFRCVYYIDDWYISSIEFI